MKGANTTLRNKPTPLSFGWGMMANVVDGGPSASLRNKPRPLGFGWGGLGKKGCRWIWGDNFKKRTHIFRLWVGGGRGMVRMDLGSNKTTDTTQHTGVSNLLKDAS